MTHREQALGEGFGAAHGLNVRAGNIALPTTFEQPQASTWG